MGPSEIQPPGPRVRCRCAVPTGSYPTRMACLNRTGGRQKVHNYARRVKPWRSPRMRWFRARIGARSERCGNAVQTSVPQRRLTGISGWQGRERGVTDRSAPPSFHLLLKPQTPSIGAPRGAGHLPSQPADRHTPLSAARLRLSSPDAASSCGGAVKTSSVPSFQQHPKSSRRGRARGRRLTPQEPKKGWERHVSAFATNLLRRMLR